MKMLQLRFFLLIVCLGCMSLAQAQSNDECETAIALGDVTNWCSPVGAYSNESASPSGFGPATCFAGTENDVWFNFTAEATDITIIIRGATNTSPGGTLSNPAAALYAGNCGGTINQLECQVDLANNDIVELYQGGLIVGQNYYIRVQGIGGNVGTFQICANNYFPPAEPTSDCPTSSVLCDKSPFVVQSVTGAGNDITELNDATCFEGGTPTNFESNSTWFVWIAANNGPLTFTLTPLSPPDDLDFVVYELPSGVDNNGIATCGDKIVRRCMASGDFSFPSPCMGPTGLAFGESDNSEPAGCNNPNQSNFLAPLDMVAGTAYALAINNFTSSNNGFSIEFGGDGEFLGPEVDFDISPELNNQCDIDQITVTDMSQFLLGNITSWSWSFGVGASPQTSTQQNPPDIMYSSFGLKTIVLTITTNLGCIVTERKDIFIEPCCDPMNDLEFDNISLLEPSCFGFEDGAITVGGSGGNTFYQYSNDGEFFQNNFVYNMLGSGNYQFWIQDRKGCVDSITLFLDQPPEFVVDAGPDITIDLGFSVRLDGTITPPDPNIQFWWDDSLSLDCVNCLDPFALPPGTTTYTLSAGDPNGCEEFDEVTIHVVLNRPIFAPNAFSPNDDGLNDLFNLFAGPAAVITKELHVYNRWGALIYKGENLPLNNSAVGWDGTFKSQAMNPDVFTWMAIVEFVDGAEVVFEGDITLIK